MDPSTHPSGAVPPAGEADLHRSLALILAKLEKLDRRLDALERPAAQSTSSNGHGAPAPDLGELLALAPQMIATATDAVDAEVASAARRGMDVDRALRNGLQAALYFGERISPPQLDALGKLLQSDILSPGAIEAVARAGRALAAASAEPCGSKGMFGLMSGSGNPDVKRSIAFLLEFARRFGALLGPANDSRAGAIAERGAR